jgi:hypothetical protein
MLTPRSLSTRRAREPGSSASAASRCSVPTCRARPAGPSRPPAAPPHGPQPTPVAAARRADLLLLPGIALARRRAPAPPALPAAPERRQLPPHGKARSAGDGCPPRRPRQRRPPRPAASRRPRQVRQPAAQACGARRRGPKALPGRLLGYPIRWPISVQEHPARRASSTNWPISSSAHEASSSLTVRATSTRSAARPALAGAPRPPAPRHLPPPYRQRNVVSVGRQAKLVTLDAGLFVPN